MLEARPSNDKDEGGDEIFKGSHPCLHSLSESIAASWHNPDRCRKQQGRPIFSLQAQAIFCPFIYLSARKVVRDDCQSILLDNIRTHDLL